MWLTREIEYTDRLVLPVGCRLPAPYDLEDNPAGFDAWALRGARACAVHNNLDLKGQRAAQLLTFIVLIDGHLRVMNRLWCTNTAPEIEREPYYRSEQHVASGITGVAIPETKGTDHVSSTLHAGSDDDCRLRSGSGPGEAHVPAGTDSSLPAGRGTLGSRADDVSDHVAAQMPRPQLPDRTGGRNGVPAAGVGGVKACGVVAVIDFMNLLVRAFHAGQPSKIHAVRGMFETICNGVLDRLCPEYVIFAMDGGHRHRSELHPEYKTHRGPRPEGLLEQIKLAERAIDALGWPAVQVDGFEADDVIASLATQFDSVALGMIMVSSDKDLLQICATTQARLYHPWGEGLYLNEKRCREKFGVGFAQMTDFLSLRGDSTDGVPGVPGVGDKTAAELLQEHQTLDQVLQAAAAGKFSGRAAKALVEHADAARLSRELVTLRTDLPVGIHWQGWPLDKPRGGWQQALQQLGLQATAQRLKQRLVDGKPRSEPSILHVETIAIDSFAISSEMVLTTPA